MQSIFDQLDKLSATGGGSTRHWTPKTDPTQPRALRLVVTTVREEDLQHGSAHIIEGVDRDGVSWSFIAGGAVLKSKLIAGEVSQWDEPSQQFVVTDVLGPVRPGDGILVAYEGEAVSARGNTYDAYTVHRVPGSQPAVLAPTAY